MSKTDSERVEASPIRRAARATFPLRGKVEKVEEETMKITRVEAFQVAWNANDRPQQRSAFVLVHTDDGITGIGEASPMQGGRASLGMIPRRC
jgi:hypothetical protein